MIITDYHLLLYFKHAEMSIFGPNLSNGERNPVITIYAEEVGPIQAGKHEWSFGNSSAGNNDHRYCGYTMAAPGKILRMSLASANRSGHATGRIQVVITVNGEETPYGIIKPVNQRAGYTIFDTPLELIAGSVINFVSKSSNNTASASTVALLIELSI